MKCPICNEEMDYLRNIATGDMEYHLSLDGQGDIQYETYEFCPDDRGNTFECPECEAVLFHKESEAVAFLKGE